MVETVVGEKREVFFIKWRDLEILLRARAPNGKTGNVNFFLQIFGY